MILEQRTRILRGNIDYYASYQILRGVSTQTQVLTSHKVWLNLSTIQTDYSIRIQNFFHTLVMNVILPGMSALQLSELVTIENSNSPRRFDVRKTISNELLHEGNLRYLGFSLNENLTNQTHFIYFDPISSIILKMNACSVLFLLIAF